MSDTNVIVRVKRRRRVVARVGVVLVMILTATACIFDKSEYQGGGRADKGATANQPTATESAPQPTDNPTSTDTTQPIPLDSGIADSAKGG